MDNLPDFMHRRWDPFLNDSGEEIPACAVMEVTRVQGEGYFRATKPTGGTAVVIMFNGLVAVPADSNGWCTADAPVQAYFETSDGTLTAGQEWGPAADDWKMRLGTAGVGGYLAVGNVTSETAFFTPGSAASTESTVPKNGYVQFLSSTASTTYPGLYPGRHGITTHNASGVRTWTTKLVWIDQVNPHTPDLLKLFDAQITTNERQVGGRYIYDTSGNGWCCTDDHPCDETWECYNAFLDACTCCGPFCCLDYGWLCWNPTIGACTDNEDECPPAYTTCEGSGADATLPCNGMVGGSEFATVQCYIPGNSTEYTLTRTGSGTWAYTGGDGSISLAATCPGSPPAPSLVLSYMLVGVGMGGGLITMTSCSPFYATGASGTVWN